MPYAIAIILGLAAEHPFIGGFVGFCLWCAWYVERHPELMGRQPVSSNAMNLSPIEYERYCANVLEEYGWTCTLTPASGDHGVDIIAEKDGRRIAIQAKRWSRPVGNSAVQEVVAGKAMYGATDAAVVTTSSYKPAAVKLAAVNGVALLRHDELGRL